MNHLRTVALAALVAVVAASVVGCGSGRYVPVSGVITLNGKPHRSAFVMFQPIGSQENPDPGRGSTGHTDENGRFTLQTPDGNSGAVPGKHRIRISTKYSDKLKGYELWDAVKNQAVKVAADPVPPEWNYKSQKEFEVPAGGTDQANFEIVGK